MSAPRPLGSTLLTLQATLREARDVRRYSYLDLDPVVFYSLGRLDIRIDGHQLRIHRVTGMERDVGRLWGRGGHQRYVHIAPTCFTADEAELYRALRADGMSRLMAQTATKLV